MKKPWRGKGVLLELLARAVENGLSPAMKGSTMLNAMLNEQLPGLPAPVLDMHRAIAALVGQLQALDSANQRFEACTDPELRQLLAHARDVARREVAMLFEWMRRRDAKLDKDMKDVLFKAGPIVAPYHYE